MYAYTVHDCTCTCTCKIFHIASCLLSLLRVLPHTAPPAILTCWLWVGEEARQERKWVEQGAGPCSPSLSSPLACPPAALPQLTPLGLWRRWKSLAAVRLLLVGFSYRACTCLYGHRHVYYMYNYMYMYLDNSTPCFVMFFEGARQYKSHKYHFCMQIYMNLHSTMNYM